MSLAQTVYVPREYQKQGVTRLGVMDDSRNSGGFFLLFFTGSEKECDYDQWYETIEQAKK